MPVVAMVTLTPKAGCGDELHRLVGLAMQHNRTEPGNIFTILMRGRDNPEDTILFEIFSDESAIDAHKVAPHTLADGPAIHALLDGPLKARFFDATEIADVQPRRRT